MFKKLIETDNDSTALMMRLLLGIVFLPHGLQKTFGWFGGYGFSGTMGFFAGTLHIPAVLAFLAIMAEFLGALGLIAGLFTRAAALAIAVEMAVAAWMLHIQNGFFMNWFGNQKGEGIEYHILAITVALALLIRGGGTASMDRILAKSSYT